MIDIETDEVKVQKTILTIQKKLGFKIYETGTRFTDSPYERMMTRRPEGGKETSRPPSVPQSHPCYGCGNYGSPCIGVCHREMERWFIERKRKK